MGDAKANGGRDTAQSLVFFDAGLKNHASLDQKRIKKHWYNRNWGNHPETLWQREKKKERKEKKISQVSSIFGAIHGEKMVENGKLIEEDSVLNGGKFGGSGLFG